MTTREIQISACRPSAAMETPRTPKPPRKYAKATTYPEATATTCDRCGCETFNKVLCERCWLWVNRGECG